MTAIKRQVMKETGYTQIDNKIFDAQPFLSPAAFSLLSRLKAECDDFNRVTISNEDLVRKSNLSKNTISKAVRELKELLILDVSYNGNSPSTYQILPQSIKEFVSSQEAKGINKKAKSNYRKRSISQSLRTQVYERDMYRCLNCGTHKDLTLDHKVPEILGGLDTLDNLQTLCRSCNSQKGTKTVQE